MDLQYASRIVARARSIADLPNTAHISHRDEIHSLNEAWKDLYAALKDNDDDYYVTETTFTVSSTYLVSGTTNEYLFPLPADFAQVRYLDYRGVAGDWWAVKKFPLSMKDYIPSEPHYRLKGNYLWVIGSNTASTSATLRMGYYPSPAVITLPQAPYFYGSSYTLLLLRGLTVPAWASLNRTMVYVGASFGITAESQTLSTLAVPVALFTEAAAPTNLMYYKGTLFWIRAAGIYSKGTALAAAFTAPDTVVAAAGVVAFHIVGDTIYYATATAIRSCTLAGASDALVATLAATSLCKLGDVVYYVTAAGALMSVAPVATIVATGISAVTCDGTYLYTLDTSYVVNRLTVDSTPALTATDELATDVGDIGHAVYDLSNEATAVGQLSSAGPSVWVLPMLTRETQRLVAIDVSLDYDFDYPNNLVPEIMAHQAAVDFRVKGQKELGDVPTRLAALWERFRSSIKRDEFTVARIKNAYDRGAF